MPLPTGASLPRRHPHLDEHQQPLVHQRRVERAVVRVEGSLVCQRASAGESAADQHIDAIVVNGTRAAEDQTAAARKKRLRSARPAKCQAVKCCVHVEGDGVAAGVRDDGRVAWAGDGVRIPVGGSVPIATAGVRPGDGGGVAEMHPWEEA